jgi:hypothetical protein
VDVPEQCQAAPWPTPRQSMAGGATSIPNTYCALLSRPWRKLHGLRPSYWFPSFIQHLKHGIQSF